MDRSLKNVKQAGQQHATLTSCSTSMIIGRRIFFCSLLAFLSIICLVEDGLFLFWKTISLSLSSTITIRLFPQQQHNMTSAVAFQYDAPESRNNNQVLNIHIVPHTHDDVGWLKTVEQYYFGYNQSLGKSSVQSILDSVVAALLENPTRTFTYVEQKFFTMWWQRQANATKESVRSLVANNQLTFVNGGWCMHDEATTHYIGMIDQTTLGHTFLKKELGVIPRVGWQLDPFGHSATQASMMTSKMGFDALFFGRIDYQDLRLRQLEQECEGLWNASTSLDDTTIFWGLTGSNSGMYGAPSGFCFDYYCKDPKLTEMNSTTLRQTIHQFLRLIRIQSDQTKSSHIMLTMGEDFQYDRARVNFRNLDALISTVQEMQASNEVDIRSIFGPRFNSVSIFYSSPDNYTKSKYKEVNAQMIPKNSTMKGLSSTNNPQLTIKRDDFFPYSDCEHCFWTGYFTSRAAFKKLERIASSFLFAARQIDSILDNNPDPIQCHKEMHVLEDASGVAQHHDGVSGTAKQHVANDYSKRLQGGIDGVATCTIRKVKRLLLGKKASEYLNDTAYCQLLNETVCDVSQRATENGGSDVYVIVYNSLSRERSSIVDLPVSREGYYQVEKIEDDNSDMKTMKAHTPSPRVGNRSAAFVVSFSTGPLPGLGACMFKVSLVKNPRDNSTDRDHIRNRMIGTEDVEASNGLFTVVFDGNNGSIKKMKTKAAEIDLQQIWGYYTSFDSKYDRADPKDRSSTATQNSGAYIFRPSTPDQQLHRLKAVSATFVNTSVGIEVTIVYDQPWIQSKTRVLEGEAHLEIEYTIGPVPIGDNRGKEVVTRFESSIASSGTFYTDSNGREFIKRIRNYRPTWKLNTYEAVAGNYYPVNAAMYIEDSAGVALSVATDRSQGGSSLADGSIELMVHRRTLADDARGVGEPMNETFGGITPCPPFGNATRVGEGIVIRGSHRVLIGSGGGASIARSMMDSMFAEPVVFVGSSSIEVPLAASTFTGLALQLPANVLLLTKKLLHSEPETTFLIRLGHQYGIGEDSKLSETVEIDLAWIFPEYEIDSVVETTLSGNQAYDSWMKSRLDWVGDGQKYESDPLLATVIKIAPMEIKTYQVKTTAVSALKFRR